MSDEYLGRVIQSKYRIEALIGEGGMGKVYRARQLALDKVVVLKVLRQSLLSDERTVARFEREAKAASRLNHPNSISILDFGQAEDGALYIAMEYVGGQDLHYLLTKQWPMPEARVIGIVAQVLSALADAHRAGVIHRDLKPENIMVEQRRGEDFVKVLDFGIAKIIDVGGSEGPALTRAGFVCGTPEYMSPEQARGAPLDNRSDLYAVGVLLYQLVTGCLPFEADSAVGFASKHLNDEPLPPSQRRPDVVVPRKLEQLILKSLSKDPNNRPQSAEEFRSELLALLPSPLAVSPSASHRRTPPPDGLGTNGVPAPMEERAARVSPLRMPPKDRGSDRPVSARKRPPRSRLKVVVGLAAVAIVLMGLFSGGLAAYTRFQGDFRQQLKTLPRLATPKVPKLEPRALYLLAPPSVSDEAKARALMQAGDDDWSRGSRSKAIERYEEAFKWAPVAELSLRLGELYFQKEDLASARGWWTRHLKDAPESKAREYIEGQLGKD